MKGIKSYLVVMRNGLNGPYAEANFVMECYTIDEVIERITDEQKNHIADNRIKAIIPIYYTEGENK